MSEKLPSREEALRILSQSGCQENVIRHAISVSKLAVEIAEAAKNNGCNVNIELVEIGGLLHDLGRAKTHSVHHAIVGAEMARSFGIPDSIIAIIERHVGGGIAASEARKLGWPKGIYTPQTLEEKIVSYSDKLMEGSKRVSIEKAIRQLSGEVPPQAIERIRKLHEEMMVFLGDPKCLR